MKGGGFQVNSEVSGVFLLTDGAERSTCVSRTCNINHQRQRRWESEGEERVFGGQCEV